MSEMASNSLKRNVSYFSSIRMVKCQHLMKSVLINDNEIYRDLTITLKIVPLARFFVKQSALFYRRLKVHLILTIQS